MHSCLQVDGTVLKQGLWRLRWPTAIFDTLHLCKRSSRLREAFSVWHIAYRLYAIFKLCVLCATVLGDVTLFFFCQTAFLSFLRNFTATNCHCAQAYMQTAIDCTGDVLMFFTSTPWDVQNFAFTNEHSYYTSGMQFNSSARIFSTPSWLGKD